MHREEFEKLVSEGFERLPEWVRQKIRNVALLIEDEPPEDVRKRERLGEDETLLGYYQGIPLSARGEYYGVGPTMPDTITLYRIPIEDAARDELSMNELDHNDLRNRYFDIVRRVVADTIWHEFAHHFGMNEHEVRIREQHHDGMVE